ncbi:uncharacterized protein PG986_005062 [Apiospora aurea]|uniref:Uncharacterized protein n=1 Tax=Apiospora aurea TaxID=335848 RepID=A0ABR1QGS2_9PEZI
MPEEDGKSKVVVKRKTSNANSHKRSQSVCGDPVRHDQGYYNQGDDDVDNANTPSQAGMLATGKKQFRLPDCSLDITCDTWQCGAANAPKSGALYSSRL